MTARYDPDVHDDYLELDDCAERMELTVAEVGQLVERRALKSFRLGFGVVFVQPAIVNI